MNALLEGLTPSSDDIDPCGGLQGLAVQAMLAEPALVLVRRAQQLDALDVEGVPFVAQPAEIRLITRVYARSSSSMIGLKGLKRKSRCIAIAWRRSSITTVGIAPRCRLQISTLYQTKRPSPSSESIFCRRAPRTARS